MIKVKGGKTKYTNRDSPCRWHHKWGAKHEWGYLNVFADRVRYLPGTCPKLWEAREDLCSVDSRGPDAVRDQLYKKRSSGKTDSQQDKRSSGIPILLKIVSEFRFSGKTYLYTIAPRRKWGRRWCSLGTLWAPRMWTSSSTWAPAWRKARESPRR